MSMTVDISKRERPECDIHKYEKNEPGVPASYDGRTNRGPWANMCRACFFEVGVGLGTGAGQQFIQNGVRL